MHNTIVCSESLFPVKYLRQTNRQVAAQAARASFEVSASSEGESTSCAHFNTLRFHNFAQDFMDPSNGMLIPSVCSMKSGDLIEPELNSRTYHSCKINATTHKS